VAAPAAVAAGTATARPAKTAALATNVVKRRPRTMAKPSIRHFCARKESRLPAVGALRRLGSYKPA
jgi:hypothetical protein